MARMTTRQADKLIGKRIKVRFPFYGQDAELTIVSRRPRKDVIVTTTGDVLQLSDMELIEVIG